MPCFTCGAGLTNKEKNIIFYYKEDYEKNGVERYVYKTSEKSDLLVVKKKYFNKIFEEQIKPNFEKGAEYFHIKEFKAA